MDCSEHIDAAHGLFQHNLDVTRIVAHSIGFGQKHGRIHRLLLHHRVTPQIFETFHAVLTILPNAAACHQQGDEGQCSKTQREGPTVTFFVPLAQLVEWHAE